MRTVVFDAGALIGLGCGDARMKALATVIVRERIPGFVPAGVVAQVWRGSPRQHALGRLLATGAVRVDPMDEDTAKAVGVMLARSGTSDVVDGHVALLGRRTRGVVYTSDPGDITALDDTLDVVSV